MCCKIIITALSILISVTYSFAQTNTVQTNWLNLYNGQSINGILSKGNDVWIGTYAGLVYINLDNDSTKLYTKDNSNLELQNTNPLCVDKNDHLVFVRGGAGPVFFNKVSFWPGRFYNSDIKSYVEDKYGNIWLGLTYLGIIKLETINGISYATNYKRNNSPMPGDNVKKIQFDKNGNLWILTYEYDFRDTLNAGLVKYDGTNWTVYNKKNSPIESNQLTDFVIDKDGAIWIGTEINSIYKFYNNTWTKYATGKIGRDISNAVSAMAVDSSNNIWVGTNFNGLYRYDGTEWELFTATNSSLRSSHIHALAVDERGGVWVGTQIGVYKYVNGDFKEYNTAILLYLRPGWKKQ